MKCGVSKIIKMVTLNCARILSKQFAKSIETMLKKIIVIEIIIVPMIII